MPELPEVQTVINSIQNDVLDCEIVSCDLYWDKIIYNQNQTEFVKIILSNYIIDIGRKGKYIIFYLRKGYMLCHLRMTGSLFVDNKKNNINHIQAIFKLKKDGIKYLHFKDVRKFGGFYYFDDIEKFNSKIGVDPFEPLFTRKWLYDNLKIRKRQMKHLLLDQSILCGLGNIYIDEVLWASGIHPRQISSRVTPLQIDLLYNSIVSILTHSIKFHGTSIKDFTYDNLKSGEYRKHIKVFDRHGRNCKACQRIIIKVKVAGRGTHICKYCQKII